MRGTGLETQVTWTSYTGCLGTQRDDTLVGSSGGASLRHNNSLAWGASNGMNSATVVGRILLCWSGSGCLPNRNLWAPFTDLTEGVQFETRVSDLTPWSSISNTASVGGTGGTIRLYECLSDEVIIGIVGSRYRDHWSVPSNPPLVLGNFGVICAPMRDSSGHFLQSDHAVVLTAGSYDTSFMSSLPGNILTFNRYRHYALSNGDASSPNQEVESFVCPGGYGVSGLSVRTLYGKVRKIEQVRCTHVFESGQPVLTYYFSGFGQTETGSTFASINCVSGKVAVRATVRAGWFTDSILLGCA